jgi:hypothetical protein
MIKIISNEEMLELMEQDAQASNRKSNKMIILTKTQEDIYLQAVRDGLLYIGMVGETLPQDINIVVDYMAEHHTIELEILDNSSEVNGNFVERPQSLQYKIKEM